MEKKFWIILTLVVVGLIGLFALSGGKESSLNTTFEGNPREVQADDWVEGPSDAPVTLIEYADFQCPGCAAIWPAIQQMKTEFADDIRFVFRHLTIPSGSNSTAAHRAAEAAGRQGQFFEMQNLLFTRVQQWGQSTDASSIFEGYAQELGLDVERFRTDVASQDVFDKIGRDKDSAGQLNITSTPSLLLNGELIENPNDIEQFRALLQEAIDTATSSQSEPAQDS